MVGSNLEDFQLQGHQGRCDSDPRDTLGDTCAEAPHWRTVLCGFQSAPFEPLCSLSVAYFLKGEEDGR